MLSEGRGGAVLVESPKSDLGFDREVCVLRLPAWWKQKGDDVEAGGRERKCV